MEEVTGILGRVSGVERSLRPARSYHSAYFLAFLLLVIPHSAFAQSNAEWTQYKIKCGVPASTAYNDWVAQGSPCNTSTAASPASGIPSIPVATTQQGLETQIGMLGVGMIASGLQQLLSGPPATPPDPAAQQRALAAEQLNNSGVYLLKQKNYAGAIDEFQQALADAPGDPKITTNLAVAKRQLEQSRRDAASATKTSGALSQLLGASSAGSTVPALNAPGATLDSIDLDSDANVVDLQGTTKTSVDPESLQNQLDGVLTNHPPVSALPDSQVVLPQAKDIELLFQPPQSTPSQSQVVLPQDKDMELLGQLPPSAPSQSQVVLPQDKDMELLGQPSPASAPSRTAPAFDSSLKDGLNDNSARASKGTGTAFFGAPTSDISDSSSPLSPNLQAAPPTRPGTNTNPLDHAKAAAGTSIAGQGAGDEETAKSLASKTFTLGGNQADIGAAPVVSVSTPAAEPLFPPAVKQALANNATYQQMGTDRTTAQSQAAAAQQQLNLLNIRQKADTDPKQQHLDQIKIQQVSHQLDVANGTIATINIQRQDIERQTIYKTTILPAPRPGLDQRPAVPAPGSN